MRRFVGQTAPWIPTNSSGTRPDGDGAEVRAEFPANRVLDFYSARVAANGAVDRTTLLDDDVHPNAEGHRRLFDVVVAADIPGAIGR